MLCPPLQIRSYALGGEIGHGAFARVFRATHVGTNEPCAIKRIARSMLNGAEDSRRLHQEASTVTYLQHPHIVSLREGLQR
jgi:serine/threonine protein kinase